MDINLQLISREQAREVCHSLRGTPTENRVVVAFNSGEKKTESGLYIPGTVKEDIPRKGVVVAIGPLTEGMETYRELIEIGSVITYGLYAGKEVEPTWKEGYTPITDVKYSVLSLNEIIYVEPNEK